VEGASDHALAGAGLSQQQQRRQPTRAGVALDDLFQPASQRHDGGALSDDLGESRRHEAVIISEPGNHWCNFHQWCNRRFTCIPFRFRSRTYRCPSIGPAATTVRHRICLVAVLRGSGRGAA
jgi:hypothetical protein